MDLQPAITAALEEHVAVIHQLTAMSSLILQVAGELVATLRRQGKVVLCGNGGSASDAQHIAAEMQGIRAHPGTPQGLLALVLTENTARYCWSTSFQATRPLLVLRFFHVLGPSKTAYARHNFRHFGVDQQYPALFTAISNDAG